MGNGKLLQRESDTDPWRFHAESYERQHDSDFAASHVSKLTTRIRLYSSINVGLMTLLLIVFAVLTHPIVLAAPFIQFGYYYISNTFVFPSTQSTRPLDPLIWCQLQIDRLSEEMGDIEPPQIMHNPETPYMLTSQNRDERTGKQLIFSSMSVLNTLRPSEVRAVIAHELAHVKFKDLLSLQLLRVTQFSVLTGAVLGVLSVIIEYVLVSSSLSTFLFTISLIIGLTVIGMITTGVLTRRVLILKEYRADMFSVQYTDGKELYNALAFIKTDYEANYTDDVFRPTFTERLQRIKQVTGSLEEEQEYIKSTNNDKKSVLT